MATGQKISAMDAAAAFASGDVIPIVSGGANEALDHDVLMADPQICQAWVNLNGTGAIAIVDDFNVESLTDNGSGDYTATYTTALADANYAVLCTRNISAAAQAFTIGYKTGGTKTTAAVQIASSYDTVLTDAANVFVAIFGGN